MAASILRTGNWSIVAIRILAVCNLLFVAYGFAVLPGAVHMSTIEPPIFLAMFPHTSQVVFAMLLANGLALSFLLWGSIHLLRFQVLGAAICCLAYAVELLSWFSSSMVAWVVLLTRNEHGIGLAKSVMANSVVGNYAIALQMNCLYPVCGIIILAAILVRGHRMRGRLTHPCNLGHV
jgi:hypothetical protein